MTFDIHSLLISDILVLYCRSVRWVGPLICVQRSGQSGQLSPAPALAPAPSVRAEGGGRPDRSSEGGGALTDTGHWGEEWGHTGLGAWHLSTLTLRLRLLGGLDTGQAAPHWTHGTHHHQSTSHRSRSCRSSLWITRSQPEPEDSAGVWGVLPQVMRIL